MQIPIIFPCNSKRGNKAKDSSIYSRLMVHKGVVAAVLAPVAPPVDSRLHVKLWPPGFTRRKLKVNTLNVNLKRHLTLTKPQCLKTDTAQIVWRFYPRTSCHMYRPPSRHAPCLHTHGHTHTHTQTLSEALFSVNKMTFGDVWKPFSSSEGRK